MTLLLKISTYLNIIIWSFPVFRQFKTKYFAYFLIIGSSDWIVIGYKLLINGRSNFPYVILSYLSLIVLFSPRIVKKYLFTLLSVIIILILIHFLFVNVWLDIFLICLINLSILYVLFTQLFNEVVEENKLNLFLFMIIFYELTIITKLATLGTGAVNNYYYYAISNMVDVLVGIFFVCFKYGNPKLIYKLKSVSK